MAFLDMDGGGDPSEQYTDKGITAKRTLIGPWVDRHTELATLLGPPGASYPYLTGVGLRAIGASCVPFQARQTEAAGLAVYEKAVITVNYSTDSPESPEEAELISETLEPTAQNQTLDHTKFRWGGNASAVVSNLETHPSILEREAPTVVRRGLTYVITRHFLAALPAAILTSANGCNDAQLVAPLLGLTFPAETLLFTPPTTNRRITTTGTEGWTAVYRLIYNPNTWNKYYRAATEAYEYMYRDGGTTPHKSAPPVDLSWIFT